MDNKTYALSVGTTSLVVEAEQEGNARFMVRLSIPNRLMRVRIGYLTGARRTWLAERFGPNAPSVPATSAKAACQSLAEWAIRQPSISPYLLST